MTNPVLHVPAHKQTDPAKQPGQIVNRIDGRLPAVKQDKGQAK